MFKRTVLGFFAAAVVVSACNGEIGGGPGGVRLGTGSTLAPELSASNGWRSVPASQPAFDTLEFEVLARAAVADIDALVAVGAQEIADFSDASIKVRFAADGTIDARDGLVYDSDVAFPYEPGVWYTIMVSADVATRTYDVKVAPYGESPQPLITGAALDPQASVRDRFTTWAAWSSQRAKLDIARQSWRASGSCAPTTCKALGVECGEPSDGCGDTLSCGGCGNGDVCDSGSCMGASPSSSPPTSSPPPAAPPPSCEPESCLSLGIECGGGSDGCGSSVSCGGCPSGKVCTSGSCVGAAPPPPPSCQPETCPSLGLECGSWSDGCGSSISCGGCSSGQVCTSGLCEDVVSTPPPVSCVPLACSDLGAQCGTQSDSCGGSVACGSCSGGQICTNGRCSAAGSTSSNRFVASRTSCMAPCAVQFNAQAAQNLTWAQVRDSHFVWDFGDGGATSEGFLGAHVFDSPGTYAVGLTVDGTPWVDETITVRAPTRTICVSPSSSFGDCPSTNASDHFTSLSAASGQNHANAHVLLHRGESFGNVGNIKSQGPTLYGAYGSGAKPALTLTKEETIGSGVILQDMTITSTNGMFNVNDWTVLRRLSVTGNQGGSAKYWILPWTTDDVYVLDSDMTLSTATDGGLIYTETSDRSVVKGNTLRLLVSGNTHVLRTNGAKSNLIQGNSFEDANGSGDMMTVRGSNNSGSPCTSCNAYWTLVQGNTFNNQWVSVKQQNTTANELIQYTIWEENTHTAGANLIVGSLLDAVVRNNVFAGGSGGASIQDQSNYYNPQDIQIIDNTCGSSACADKTLP